MKLIGRELILPLFMIAAHMTGVTAFAQDQSSTLQSDESRFQPLLVELFEALPKNGTYAFQGLSSEESGLPETMLKQLSSDLQAEFLLASDFNAKVIDKAQLSNSWRDAVEFNGANFEELMMGANFDAAIIFTIRAVVDGFQISAQAIGTTSANSGQVLASTSVHKIKTDWQKESSIRVMDSDEMSQILAEIAALAKGDALAEHPSTFAEHYHNAKLYLRQSLFDSAIASYVEALKLQPELVDVLFDTIDLAQARYGGPGATKFLEMKLGPVLPDPMVKLRSLYTSVFVGF